jgi:hypothetical protein
MFGFCLKDARVKASKVVPLYQNKSLKGRQKIAPSFGLGQAENNMMHRSDPLQESKCVYAKANILYFTGLLHE